MTPVLQFIHVTKTYTLPAGDVIALDDVSFTVEPGEFVAVMGPSGSGKTTLLNLMGCLDVPTEGEICINGTSIADMNDNELTHVRLNTIGFIFQYFHLFPLLNIIENVTFPQVMKDKGKANNKRAHEILQSVQLETKLYTHRPNELSGGQQQRVAIARALINDPPLILCDEPTGNLDSKTGRGIMEMLFALREAGRTIIMVTHDPNNAEYATRIIQIRDGQIE
ncbi:MAG: ABC transporter ATP-binding protein [Euryarchaeota archaeon]|nr:ABC transporter ATP-binding protein [Euryarchaeota archaeon]